MTKPQYLTHGIAHGQTADIVKHNNSNNQCTTYQRNLAALALTILPTINAMTTDEKAGR